MFLHDWVKHALASFQFVFLMFDCCFPRESTLPLRCRHSCFWFRTPCLLQPSSSGNWGHRVEQLDWTNFCRQRGLNASSNSQVKSHPLVHFLETNCAVKSPSPKIQTSSECLITFNRAFSPIALILGLGYFFQIWFFKPHKICDPWNFLKLKLCSCSCWLPVHVYATH